jgi:hypothetical protein
MLFFRFLLKIREKLFQKFNKFDQENSVKEERVKVFRSRDSTGFVMTKIYPTRSHSFQL